MLGQHLKSVDHNFSSRECASVRERELSIQGNAYKTTIKVKTPFTTIYILYMCCHYNQQVAASYAARLWHSQTQGEV